MARTLSDLKFISPATLKSWLTESSKPRFAIVDVRDSDHVGGHIRGSHHFPSSDLPSHLTEIKQLVDDNKLQALVFHCALSQARGPKAALLFLRALDDSPEDENLNNLDVYVLKGGFTNWARHYGNDSSVTADYAPDLWE